MEKKRKDQKHVNTVQGWWDSVSSFFRANAVPLFWWAVLGIIFVVAVFIVSVWHDTLARNLIFAFAAVIGLPLAIWRSIVADRQSKTAQRQSETAQKQSETAQQRSETAQQQFELAQQQFEIAQRGLLNERYQKGAEMLGNAVLSVRLGGIYALENLAREHAEDYHVLIIKILCAFVRNPPRDENDSDAKNESDTEKHPKIREDVQAIMKGLGRRNEEQQEIEKQEISKVPGLDLLDLNGANLSGAVLYETDLSCAVLIGANLSHAELRDANLSYTRLYYADLSYVRFESANLSRAQLYETDLSRANLVGANLSGAELDGANLSDAELRSAKFPNAVLHRADLSGAWLYDADFSSVVLNRANLSGARLGGVRGLTQAQLDQAVADPDNPPDLTDVKDSKTGKPLVWRGKVPPESSS